MGGTTRLDRMAIAPGRGRAAGSSADLAASILFVSSFVVLVFVPLKCPAQYAPTPPPPPLATESLSPAARSFIGRTDLEVQSRPDHGPRGFEPHGLANIRILNGTASKTHENIGGKDRVGYPARRGLNCGITGPYYMACLGVNQPQLARFFLRAMYSCTA